MKNTKIYSSVFCLAFLFFIVGCQKEHEKDNSKSQPKSNYIIVSDNDSKTTQNCIISANIGHDGKNCPGCILINGRLRHQDCQGYGHVCNVSANVTLYNNGVAAYAVTTDTFGLTDQAFFNMPDRSLFVEYDDKNNEVWLNIPAQLVYRDSTTLQFTFTGLYYSNSQIYEND